MVAIIDKFARYWLGLTAVSLLLLLTACAQPTATPTVTATAVPATATASPPTPTPEPTATPTLTVEELRDERATAVLTTLPGYDLAQHDALLPLARALWGDEHQVEPADVTLVVGETAVQVTSDAAYPSGTLFVWNADSHPQPLILTGQENSAINRGEVAFGAASLNTWVRYDVDGNVLEFVDPASNWISPLDIQTDGGFSFFTQERILADGSRENTNTVWWANGGQPAEIPNGPDSTPMANFLDTNPGLQLTQTEGPNGRHLVALIDTDTQELRYTLDDGGNWTIVEQAPLTVREFYSDDPFTFLPDDRRGVGRELPEGIDRILTLQELDERARAIGFTPEYGCSTEFGSDGRFHTVAVVLSHGTAQLNYPAYNITLNYDGFWLQTCGVGPNGELVPVIFFAPFQGTKNDSGTITHLDEHSRVNFNTWNRATGQVEPNQTLSPTYLANNREVIVGQVGVLWQPSNTDNNPISHAFADLVNSRRNGFADIDGTGLNYDYPGLRPFIGTVALDKP